MDTSTPELGVTKAVEKPISDLARVRIDLKTYDDIYYSLGNEWTDNERQRFNEAQWAVNLNLSAKLHMLIDTIDQQAKELDALRAQVGRMETDIDSVIQTVNYISDKSDNGEWGGHEISFQLNAEMKRLEMFKP